jgi:hypothetical protein
VPAAHWKYGSPAVNERAPACTTWALPGQIAPGRIAPGIAEKPGFTVTGDQLAITT